MRPHVSPMSEPVAVEPVKEISGTPGCSTSAFPTVSPRPCTSWMTSGGRPASSRISTRIVQVCGTSSDGLRMTELPQSSAGNVFHVGIASGKLNGVMSPATPIGRRMLMAHFERSSLGTTWPNRRRPSVAA